MRIRRVIEPTVTYHVISRFVDKRWYLETDEDRELYLRLLGTALRESDWRLLAYALMSSHTHLEVIAGFTAFGALMKRVHAPFARIVNERRAGLGPLFADRPAAWGLRTADEGRAIAYIHNNPVRANVASSARDSAWTSHRAYIGLAPRPAWLAVDEGLARCGVEAAEFDAWVASTLPCDLTESVAGIHRVARRRGAIELGTPISNPLVTPLVARRFARIRPDPRVVVALVASTMGVAPETITSRTHEELAVRARRIAVRSGVAVGLCASEMAAALGVSRQAAAKMLRLPLEGDTVGMMEAVVRRLTKIPPSPTRDLELFGIDSRRG